MVGSPTGLSTFFSAHESDFAEGLRQPPGHWERLAFQRHCVHRLVRDQQVCNRGHHEEQDQCGLPRSSPDHNADTHPREHHEQNVKRHRVDQQAEEQVQHRIGDRARQERHDSSEPVLSPEEQGDVLHRKQRLADAIGLQIGGGVAKYSDDGQRKNGNAEHGANSQPTPHRWCLFEPIGEPTTAHTRSAQPSAENRMPASGMVTPGHTRIPDSNSQRLPISAPSPTTASLTTARSPIRAPAPTTDRASFAPAPITAPSKITDPSMLAPAPTVTPRPIVVPPVSEASGAICAPGSTSAAPTGPGSASVGAIPVTRSADPRTNAAGVPRSSQYVEST